MYKHFIKPFFDSLSAAIGLVLLSPLFILVTIFLAFANDGKPFFFQLRPGKNGKIFKIVKFKTMNDKKNANGKLLPDAERLTKIGAFVRRTSLDEIPQLINVVKGDMSIIGPRPLLTHYLHLYNDFQNRRHEVKPGITGGPLTKSPRDRILPKQVADERTTALIARPPPAWPAVHRPQVPG